VVLASLVGVIIFRLIFEHDWLSQDGFEGVPADRLLPILTASVLNGISILVLKQLYNKMAVKLTDWENHQTQSAYEDSLVVKLFAFHFADSFASLFYIAFLRNTRFKGGFAGLGNKYHDSCGEDYDCMTMLTINVAVLMFMQPLATILLTIVWPWIKKKWKESHKKQTANVLAEFSLDSPKKTEFAVKVQQAAKLLEQQRCMQTLHNFHLNEYSEKVIMYGYLMIFATAFPLAPLVALLTNIFDLRLDAKRLVWHTRRPVAEIAHNIGLQSWFACL
jgi:anoctamin-5